MKKLIFVFIVFFSFSLSAQDSKNSIKVTKKDSVSYIFNSEFNVLYKGWNNKIKVIPPNGYSKEDIKVECINCSISEKCDFEGNYIVKVMRGNTAYISMYIFNENEQKIYLGKSEFRISLLPAPTAYFGGRTGGVIDVKSALNAELIVSLGFHPLNVSYNVLSFDLVINKQTFSSNGNILTGQMRSAISKSNSGDELGFTNIIIQGPANIQQLYSGILLKIK